MASRLMANRQYAHERDIKYVYAKVAIGATGAPTLDVANSKGVLSITRNGVGDYTVVFGFTGGGGQNVLDTYAKFLDAQLVVQNAAGIPLVEGFGIKAIDISGATASVRFQMFHAAVTTNVNTAADPTSGDTLYLSFAFGDSTAG